MEAKSDLQEKIKEDHVNKIVSAFWWTRPEQLSTQFETILEVFDHFNVDIAVTGESGSGKSSLINALLRLNAEDEEAAHTGVVETTMEPAMYQHPYHPHVRFWDLPGMGTPSFKSQSYVKTINFDLYDVYIVVLSERVRENNMIVIDEIQRRKKPFYVVRSKVDNDVLAQRRKRNTQEVTILERIRIDCIKNLQKKDLNPHVFLVSAHDTVNYDMQKLMHTLHSELPQIKIDVFSLYLSNLFGETRSKSKDLMLHTTKNGKIREEDILKINAVFKRSDLSNGAPKVNALLTALEHFRLDAAVIGETGSGTTSLIKALTCTEDNVYSAEPTYGTIGEPVMYSYPRFPSVRLWDVSSFEQILDYPQADLKLEHVINDYDFYIVVVSESWQETHLTELVRAITDLGKQYYLVQTVTDSSLTGEYLCPFEVEMLDRLQAAGISLSQVSLVHSFDRNALHFVTFESKLTAELPAIRKSAFLQCTVRILKQKAAQSTCRIL